MFGLFVGCLFSSKNFLDSLEGCGNILFLFCSDYKKKSLYTNSGCRHFGGIKINHSDFYCYLIRKTPAELAKLFDARSLHLKTSPHAYNRLYDQGDPSYPAGTEPAWTASQRIPGFDNTLEGRDPTRIYVPPHGDANILVLVRDGAEVPDDLRRFLGGPEILSFPEWRTLTKGHGVELVRLANYPVHSLADIVRGDSTWALYESGDSQNGYHIDPSIPNSRLLALVRHGEYIPPGSLHPLPDEPSVKVTREPDGVVVKINKPTLCMPTEFIEALVRFELVRPDINTLNAVANAYNNLKIVDPDTGKRISFRDL